MGNRIAVTGASSEIGLAICERLAETDVRFLLHCHRNKERLVKLKEERGLDCEIVSADFNDRQALDEFCGRLGDLDVLINLAAVTKTALLPAMDHEDITATLNVNIGALIAVCRAALPSMLSRRRGCIVNISSVAAKRGSRGQSVYAGSKGFMESFSRALAAEYGPRGVRINCIAPGPIEAGSLRELLSYGADEVLKSNVKGKPGSPADVAAAVAYLCRDEAAYINGTVMAIDGGFCAGV